MKKDIFIDNNIASKFSNPQDKEYIKLTKWLINYNSADSNKNNYAHLMISQKLLVEYKRSAINAVGNSAITSIIDKLTREGRLTNITNTQIKEFQRVHFKKAVEKKLSCNSEDRQHIPLVMLSERKYALSYDDDFIKDILNFPGFNAKAAKRPEALPYEQ